MFPPFHSLWTTQEALLLHWVKYKDKSNEILQLSMWYELGFPKGHLVTKVIW